MTGTSHKLTPPRPRCAVLVQLLVVVLLASLSVGCRKLLKRGAGGAGSSASSASPPTLVWKESSLEFPELPSARGSFLVTKSLTYDVSFYGLPSGTSLAVDGAAAGSGPNLTWSMDFSEIIGAMNPAQALDYKFKVDPKKKGELTFASGAKVSFALPPLGVSFGLGDALKASIDRPVLFGKNDAGRAAAHTVILLSPSAEVLGPARQMVDVDWVAVDGTTSEREGRVCEGYRKTGETGSAKSFRLKLVDKPVHVVERASSKIIATREFKAKDECPTIAFSGEAKSYPRTEEIKEWLRDLRAK